MTVSRWWQEQHRGAFFSMSSLDETLIDQAYFISPVVDMEQLILNMMQWRRTPTI